MINHRHPRPAFTLVELLVAITIMVLMMGIIDQVYNSTAQAVSRGVGLSKIIANNRALNAQITRDGDNMRGPGAAAGAGFLVIVNHAVVADMPESSSREPAATYAYTSTTAAPSSTWAPANDPSQHRELIRDDQLVFIRTNGANLTATARALMPSRPTSYANYLTTSNILVWYGHALRTDKYGNFDAGAPATPQLGINSTYNRLASQWILARQGMFLADGTTLANYPRTTVSASSPAPGGAVNWPLAPAAGSANFMGTCDIAHFSFDSSGSDAATTGYLVGSANATPYPILNADTGAMTATQYQSNALSLLYKGAYRLRVNLSPTYDPANTAYQYAAWQIAQMHGALAVNVSDFQVAFAADLTGDGQLDRVTTDQIWKGITVLPAGSIKWYVAPGYQNDPNYPGTSNNGLGFELNQPVTFAYTYAGTGFNPVTSPPAFTVGTLAGGFVWRHDDSTSKSTWPYLLRIRYRMHDSQGRVETGNHVQGMWFEHIIRVPR